MKYAVITPTFEPHFQFVEKYLESFDKFVIDKSEVAIIFTISKSESNKFNLIINKYKNINIEIFYFEDILAKFGINITPNDLLRKYDKFTFQSLKKFYTMLYSDFDYFLVLDSESMWIKKTSMKALFENFFNNPFISCSSIANRKHLSDFTQGVLDNRNFLINNNCNKWFLENFVWFYDKKILNEMFETIGEPIELAEKIYNSVDEKHLTPGIFEIELYQSYIYCNNGKYKYKINNIDNDLKSYLCDFDFHKYKTEYDTIYDGNCGVLEHSLMLLTNSNYKALAKLFIDNKFNIIRCDKTNFNNAYLQTKFIEIVSPNILAASQLHIFGINDKYEMLVKQNKYYFKFYKHFNCIFHSNEFHFSLLGEPFSLLFYFFKWMLKVQKLKKIYKEVFN